MNVDTRAWEVWDRRECVGRHATQRDAIRECRNDMGRFLSIYDPIGRVVANMRDGRTLDADAS